MVDLQQELMLSILIRKEGSAEKKEQYHSFPTNLNWSLIQI